MKVIIAGSRDIEDYNVLLNLIERCEWDITEVVSGCAYGADALGERWAKENNIPIQPFNAEWNKYYVPGKKNPAGFIRNKEMAKYADAAIILWDGRSSGSKNMIDEMRIARKPYIIEILEGTNLCTKTSSEKLKISLPI